MQQSPFPEIIYDEFSSESFHDIDDNFQKHINDDENQLEIARSKYDIYNVSYAFEPTPPTKWVVDRLIREGSFNILVGQAGHMKTFSMLALAGCLSDGLVWAGLKTEVSKVLYIDEESGQQRLKDRIRMVMNGYGIDHSRYIPFFYIASHGLNLVSNNGRNELQEMVALIKPNVVIIDALVDIMPGADENKVGDVQVVMSFLRDLAHKQNISIIVLHHMDKGGKGYRGSSAIGAAADLVLNVTFNSKSHQLCFKSDKVRDGEPLKISVKSVVEENSYYLALPDRDDKEHLTPLGMFIIRHIKKSGPLDTKSILNAAIENGYRETTTQKGINELVRANYLERTNDGGRGKGAIYGITIKSLNWLGE